MLEPVQISDIAAVAVPNNTDVFVLEQGGVTYSITRANIVAAVQAALTAEIATTDAEITSLQTTKLNLAGGTLTGQVAQALTPVAADDLTRKGYVDTALTLKLNLTGGTMSGDILLAGDPTNILHPSTKQYTDTVNLENIKLLEDFAGITTFPTTYGGGGILNGHAFFVTSAGTLVGGTIAVSAGSVLIARTNAPTDVTADWAILEGNILSATGSSEGIIKLAAKADVSELLTEATTAVTPLRLGNFADAYIFNRTPVGIAGPTALVELNSGLIPVTYSATGATAITLPVISTLVSPLRVIYKILDEGLNASVNHITISAGAGNTIDGLASVSITGSGDTLILTTDGGTKWYADKGGLHQDASYGWMAASQLIPDITWTSLVYDTVGAVNTKTQLAIGTGIYTSYNAKKIRVSAQVYFSVDAVGVRGVRIMEDTGGGPLVRAEQIIGTYATYNASINISTVFSTSATSTTWVEVFQSSGGALNCVGGSIQDSHIRILEA